MRRIGIMGGTFDPIHYGHLVAAEGARCHFDLDEVIFVPAGIPPHKIPKQISDSQHRLIMTHLAVSSNPFFTVSAIEIEREGMSYTIDTVREISGLYQSADIYFITGADAVLEILSWKNVMELLSMCFIIAATRPGYKMISLKEGLPGISEDKLKKIIVMEVPALAISSTDIRQRILSGKPIKYLLPENVEKYIKDHNLYRD